MTTNEIVRDTFSILHDGTICNWTGNHDVLTLTVDCEYLAERIDKSFEKFYLEILKIDKIELDPWTTQSDLPSVIKTDLAGIFKAELEILEAKIENDTVVIYCNQFDKSFDYCGGGLMISCQSIKINDQNKNEITITQFEEICEGYWNELRDK